MLPAIGVLMRVFGRIPKLMALPAAALLFSLAGVDDALAQTAKKKPTAAQTV